MTQAAMVDAGVEIVQADGGSSSHWPQSRGHGLEASVNVTTWSLSWRADMQHFPAILQTLEILSAMLSQ